MQSYLLIVFGSFLQTITNCIELFIFKSSSIHPYLTVNRNVILYILNFFVAALHQGWLKLQPMPVCSPWWLKVKNNTLYTRGRQPQAGISKLAQRGIFTGTPAVVQLEKVWLSHPLIQQPSVIVGCFFCSVTVGDATYWLKTFFHKMHPSLHHHFETESQHNTSLSNVGVFQKARLVTISRTKKNQMIDFARNWVHNSYSNCCIIKADWEGCYLECFGYNNNP